MEFEIEHLLRDFRHSCGVTGVEEDSACGVLCVALAVEPGIPVPCFLVLCDVVGGFGVNWIGLDYIDGRRG